MKHQRHIPVTPWNYGNKTCQCDQCRAAHNAKIREYRRRKAAR